MLKQVSRHKDAWRSGVVAQNILITRPRWSPASDLNSGLFSGKCVSKHAEDNDGYPVRLIGRYGLRILIVDGSPVLFCVTRNLSVEISEEIQRVPIDSRPLVTKFLLCMSLGTCHLVLMIRHEYLLSDKT